MERERDIHPAQLHPSLFQALRLATEAQRLVEVAKTQRQSAEAKVGVPQMRDRKGWLCGWMMQWYVKNGGEYHWFLDGLFQDFDMYLG